MNRQIRVEAQADPKVLEALRGLVRGFAQSCGLSSDRVDEIVLAVDEACCNSIRHSYDSNPARSFVLAMGATDHYIEFELRDSGKPAPRDRVAPPRNTPPNRRDLNPGGLGIRLIYRVFDTTVFEPGRTRGNRVLMRARRNRADGKRSPENAGPAAANKSKPGKTQDNIS